MSSILLPSARLERWVHNFAVRHGETSLEVCSGVLSGTAADSATFTVRLPFARNYDGPAQVEEFQQRCVPPAAWGVLLVRKGGFAIARLAGDRVVESKVGQRHVQGRTKAGGQSQQRFARRRDNQARAAYEAAAGHAHRILTDPLTALVCGGDRSAVEQVLGDPRLRRLAERRVDPWLAVPDPRRSVLEQAAVDGRAVRVDLTNA